MPLRIYLSGRFDVGTKVEKAWLKLTGCKHRCFTFANLDVKNKHYNKRVEQSLAVCEKQGVSIMMDSGAASLHNIQASVNRRGVRASKHHDTDTTKVANDLYNRYVKFCLVGKDNWEFYVTLDFKKHQPTIFKMQKRFERSGLNPVPVYHGDSGLDWLDKYADRGCTLIGVGNSKDARSRGNKLQYRYYLDKVFDRAAKLNLNLHGLAVTSLSLMYAYPWWSVDSATWTKTASYGCLNFPDFDKGVIYNLHVSEKHSTQPHSYNKMSNRHRAHVRETLKALGFDIKQLAVDVGVRHDFNGMVFSKLASGEFDLHRPTKRRWESLV